METSITPFFTKIDFQLPFIATKLRTLLRTQIDAHLLPKGNFMAIHAQILEIWLDARPIEAIEVIQMARKAKDKYLSFTCILPYHKIMKEEKDWLLVFIEEFFSALAIILMPYQVEKELIEEVKENVKKEVTGNDTYIGKPSKDMVLVNEILKNLKLPSANKEKVV